MVLCFYALGLCGYFLQQILTRAFYSMQDSKIPARSALIAVIINIVLNLSLVWSMGIAGLALSTAICSYIQVIILVFALQKSLGSALLDRLAVTILKTAAATAIMAAACGGLLYLLRNLPDSTRFDILKLVVVVPAAATVYLLSAKLLRMKEIGLLGSGRYERL
ncbi:lipid II flippase MurJ [subsurface metagenome]